MQLLINTIPLLGQQTGVGNYTRQIARATSVTQGFDTTFFYGWYSRRLPTPEKMSSSWLGSVKSMIAGQTLIRRVCKKSLSLATSAYRLVSPKTFDCYFEPNFILLPAVRACCSIVTVHDFSSFLYPQWHPVARVRYMKRNLRASLEKADHIITVSETIRQEAINLFNVPAARITTIYNGVDHNFYQPCSPEAVLLLRKQYNLPEHFILFVGTLEPRKNVSNLLLAHAALPDALKRRFPLVLLGSRGWSNTDILALIRLQAEHVRLLGYVPEKDLPAFYSAASLFAYPSWYEGFGLPVLEAMACGCPVLTSDHASLQEICAGAARHTPAGDVSSMRSVLLELLEDTELREALRQKGLERAAQFSWAESARRHMQLFQDVCAS